MSKSVLLPVFIGILLRDLGGDTEVPICVFLLFPPAPSDCISITVAQQRRHKMSQHTWNWHRGEQLVLRWYAVIAYPFVIQSKFPPLMGGVHARHPPICVRH